MSNTRISDLGLLYPTVAQAATMAFTECQNKGLSIHPFETLRTPERQQSLWMRGRDLSGAVVAKSQIVTKAKAGQSWHQYGLAVDAVFKTAEGAWTWDNQIDLDIKESYKKAAHIFSNFGFHWLGNDPKFPEMPHFQMTYHLNMPELKAIYDRSGLPAVYFFITKELKQSNV